MRQIVPRIRKDFRSLSVFLFLLLTASPFHLFQKNSSSINTFCNVFKKIFDRTGSAAPFNIDMGLIFFKNAEVVRDNVLISQLNVALQD